MTFTVFWSIIVRVVIVVGEQKLVCHEGQIFFYQNNRLKSLQITLRAVSSKVKWADKRYHKNSAKTRKILICRKRVSQPLCFAHKLDSFLSLSSPNQVLTHATRAAGSARKRALVRAEQFKSNAMLTSWSCPQVNSRKIYRRQHA